MSRSTQIHLTAPTLTRSSSAQNKTNSILAVLICVTLFICLALSTSAAAAEKHPNVLLINVDDLGWVDIQCYAKKFNGNNQRTLPTPNIDRLAKEGMIFSDAYAACNVCSPTRASIMSGQYPARTKITDWIRPDRAKKVPADWVPTLTEKPTGKSAIRTALNLPFLPTKVVTIAELLQKEGYRTAHIGKWHLGREEFYPECQGFEFNRGGGEWGHPYKGYFDPYGGNMPHMKPRKKGEFLAFREADEVLNFLKTSDKSRPFYINFWPYEVHNPIQAPADLVAKTPSKKDKYSAMIHALDISIGTVLDYLDENKLTDDTFILFTSDNGGLHGNAPLRAAKGTPYEGGVRVPFIVRWKGKVNPDTVCDVPIISTDILPTICQVVGAALPKAPLDGVSLVPVLMGKETKLDRDALYWHFPQFRGNIQPHSAVRLGDWKLIWYYTDKEPQLFNLKDDLSESNNLAKDNPERVKELKARLDKFNKDTGALVPQK